MKVSPSAKFYKYYQVMSLKNDADKAFFDDFDDDYKDLSVSRPSSWPYRSLISQSVAKAAKDEAAVVGATQPQPKVQKPNVIPIMFDVIIGSPKQNNNNNKNFVVNSSDKLLYLSFNRYVIQTAIKTFNDNIKKYYNQTLPRVIIKSGCVSLNTGKDIELLFYGLIFDDIKITASFIYYDDAYDEFNTIESLNILNEINRTCEFFILGEYELDETEEHITDMKIESFGYVNRIRNIREQLYKQNEW
jgi:hypothetical protein